MESYLFFHEKRLVGGLVGVNNDDKNLGNCSDL